MPSAWFSFLGSIFGHELANTPIRIFDRQMIFSSWQVRPVFIGAFLLSVLLWVLLARDSKHAKCPLPVKVIEV